MDRFWEKVEPEPNTGCWLWIGATSQEGYGQVNVNKTRMNAQKYAYLLFVGSVPNRTDVAHKCDMRSCVNPTHLFLATRKENMQDMVRKGRSLKGELQPNAKLTAADVREIRAKWDKGMTVTALGQRFGIRHSHVRRILTGERWGWLD